MNTYADLLQMYGVKNVKQLGNKIIVMNPSYGLVYGYEIATYSGLEPDTLKNKVFTDLNNTGYNWDKAYDVLFGAPQAPDFSNVIIRRIK